MIFLVVFEDGCNISSLESLGISSSPSTAKENGLTMLSASSLCLGCSASNPMVSYGPKFLKRSLTWSSATAGKSSLPWILSLASKAHEILSVKTEVKVALISGLSASIFTKSGFSRTPTFSLFWGFLLLLQWQKLLLSLFATLGVLKFSQHLTLNISLEICSISS